MGHVRLARAERRVAHDGFIRCDSQVKPRLILVVNAATSRGKTHFSFTAPGPIAYFNFDFGDEGVAQKFQSKKEIWKNEEPLTINPDSFGSDKARALAADEKWSGYCERFRYALLNFRTVVIDTETEQWELVRLARFGKLSGVMPIHYGPVNAEYRGLINEAFESDANVIYLQKLKNEYVDDKATGKVVPGGFSELVCKQGEDGELVGGYKPQVICHSFRRDGKFGLVVQKCRLNPDLEGMELEQPDNTFASLAQMVLPDSSEEDWK